MIDLNDHITIIGSGPTGLTLALILKYYGYSVTILERESTPGGCHRVTRVNDMFTEHGPRIYTSGSKTFHHMLQKAGLDHKKYFTPYKAQVSEPLLQSLKYFNSSDMFRIVSSYLKFVINPKFGSDMTVNQLELSTPAASYADKMCRLTDGAGADRYTLNSFLRLIDHKFAETIQQPQRANDKEGGWVADLVKQLKINGVSVQLNQEVQTIRSQGSAYTIVTTDGSFKTDVILFATPTDALEKILSNSPDIADSFGPLSNLKEFNKHSLYETYLPVTLHWRSTPVNLPRIWGNGIGEWNIAWINITDYVSTEPGTVISACITNTNAVNINGKTANDCTEHELKMEVLRQLDPLINGVRKPDAVILSPEIYRAKDKWLTRDNAYMRTPMDHIGRPSKAENNKIFSVGCHNEHNTYKFTSVESAVQNAYYWAHEQIEGSDKFFPIISSWTLSLVLKYAIIMFIIVYVVIGLLGTGNKVYFPLNLRRL
jgi:predicted NAD/FAD-dependent oxidoreductase